MTKTKTPYIQLPVVPTMIAMRVTGTVYKGQDLTPARRDGLTIKELEEKRKAMTDESRHEFAAIADKMCLAAYEAESEWFMTIVRKRTSLGRDQLDGVIWHWLTIYLNNPDALRKLLQSSPPSIVDLAQMNLVLFIWDIHRPRLQEKPQRMLLLRHAGYPTEKMLEEIKSQFTICLDDGDTITSHNWIGFGFGPTFAVDLGELVQQLLPIHLPR